MERLTGPILVRNWCRKMSHSSAQLDEGRDAGASFHGTREDSPSAERYPKEDHTFEAHSE